jgi:sulfotransferase
VKTFNFLAGLPRSGSTVLSALLNQHPSVHASGTSGMGELMFNTLQAWKNSSAEQAAPQPEQIKAVLRGIMDTKYSNVDKPVVIDKARNWAEASTIAVLKELLPYKPKIIATVRNIDECAASFVRVAKPNNVEDFLRNDGLIGHLKESYTVLHSGFQYDKSCFLFVEYEDMMADARKQMARIHEFLEISDFDYDYDHLDEYAPKERDEEIWGVLGLHTVAPKLAKRHNEDPEDVLQHMRQNFVQPCFWREKPLTTEMIHPLDVQLAAGIIGDFEKGEEIAQELAIKEPKNHRAAFNRGWYEMRKGHLLDGMKLLDRGRIEKVFWQRGTESADADLGRGIYRNSSIELRGRFGRPDPRCEVRPRTESARQSGDRGLLWRLGNDNAACRWRGHGCPARGCVWRGA